jgi:hypothetical protein
MSPVPSIKGTVLLDLAEDVSKILEGPGSGRRAVEAHLTAEDRERIAEGLSPAAWYDVDFYARMMELVRDVRGDGRDQYVVDRGRARGRKLMEAGLYQQMEYVGRLQVSSAQTPEDRLSAYGRDLRLLVTLSRSILNFTTWNVQIDPDSGDRHRIDVGEAGAFPDILGLSTEGFIDAMASQRGDTGLWRYERLGRDLVVFRMTRSLAL